MQYNVMKMQTESDIKCRVSAETSKLDMRRKIWIWNVNTTSKATYCQCRVLAAFQRTLKHMDIFWCHKGQLHTHTHARVLGVSLVADRDGEDKDMDEMWKFECKENRGKAGKRGESQSVSPPRLPPEAVIREQQTLTLGIDPFSNVLGTRSRGNDRIMLCCFLSLKMWGWCLSARVRK